MSGRCLLAMVAALAGCTASEHSVGASAVSGGSGSGAAGAIDAGGGRSGAAGGASGAAHVAGTGAAGAGTGGRRSDSGNAANPALGRDPIQTPSDSSSVSPQTRAICRQELASGIRPSGERSGKR